MYQIFLSCFKKHSVSCPPSGVQRSTWRAAFDQTSSLKKTLFGALSWSGEKLCENRRQAFQHFPHSFSATYSCCSICLDFCLLFWTRLELGTCWNIFLAIPDLYKWCFIGSHRHTQCFSRNGVRSKESKTSVCSRDPRGSAKSKTISIIKATSDWSFTLPVSHGWIQEFPGCIIAQVGEADTKKKPELFSMELNDKVIYQTAKISSAFLTEEILGVGEKIHFFRKSAIM